MTLIGTESRDKKWRRHLSSTNRVSNNRARAKRRTLLAVLWVVSLVATAVLVATPEATATSSWLESTQLEVAFLDYLRNSSRSQQEISRSLSEIRRELQLMRECGCRDR